MKKTLAKLLILLTLTLVSCKSDKKENNSNTDADFASFETKFLDAYWKQYPSLSIVQGYGKYYDKLVVPNTAAFEDNVNFSKKWLADLEALDFDQLSDNNKISSNIIKNQLESDIWYTTVFKQQEWDASLYNISGSCDYIINQPYASLDERLKILTKYLENSDAYYKAALENLKQPTKEHLEMAINQNKGGLEIFGKALTDSIAASHLNAAEKDALQKNITKAKTAMNDYVSGLQKIDNDKNFKFKDYRIGKKLFAEKFKYDIAADFTPEQIYEKAVADKKMWHKKMYVTADKAWAKYYPNQAKPKDSLEVIRMVLKKMQDNHATPANFYPTLKKQVTDLKKFIIEKNLFDFDTAATPIVVRYMPVYARGFAMANAEFIPPYQKKGTTYYNIDDLTAYPSAKAESALRETNNYSSQILSIHEAVPGHCMQGIYNNKKSPDVLRAVFQNGAMIEGWAVYCEGMMVENGWGNHEPEIELALGVWKLRELANVIIDYDIQCLNKPKEDIVKLLSHECFQTDQQVEEKYHRATVSQVQLCSYFSGASAIQQLRDDYQKKMGDKYSLKDFHEKFLSFGSSPVKYIRERMLE
ncbi:DUF885 domain-containing protein [Flavobacterium wongokense]|uniref:DUF885 domain-containing protein n=1 Tax=Flavobacterium wongokense TaxID=2910674 RepID=UPI001F3C68AB|nr:DUF885 domain-containing protein [Flavobacterium sp. WG47]MCF6130762.1 DUF885 domain-containing protein [Flavobacterium sp. WG47]